MSSAVLSAPPHPLKYVEHRTLALSAMKTLKYILRGGIYSLLSSSYKLRSKLSDLVLSIVLSTEWPPISGWCGHVSEQLSLSVLCNIPSYQLSCDEEGQSFPSTDSTHEL